MRPERSRMRPPPMPRPTLPHRLRPSQVTCLLERRTSPGGTPIKSPAMSRTSSSSYAKATALPVRSERGEPVQSPCLGRWHYGPAPARMSSTASAGSSKRGGGNSCTRGAHCAEGTVGARQQPMGSSDADIGHVKGHLQLVLTASPSTSHVSAAAHRPEPAPNARARDAEQALWPGYSAHPINQPAWGHDSRQH